MSAAADTLPAEREVVTEGRSMFPLIRAGTRVFIRPVAPAELRPGDIIAFRDGERTVVHRLIQARRDAGQVQLREKGDNNPAARWIAPETVLGRAVRAERNGSVYRLEALAGRWRWRAWTRCSRLEADLVEALAGMRKRLLPGPLDRPTRWRGALLRGLLFPFKALLAPWLLSVVKSEPAVGRDEDARFMLSAFRSLCAGAAVNAGEAGRPDPARLLLAADAHGLLPWMVTWWQGRPELSSGERAALEEGRRRRYRAAIVHMSALATVQDIHQALTAAGIPYAVLKGPALTAQLYTQDAFRSYADVDVVVRRRDREKAIGVLTEKLFTLKGSRLNQQLVRWGHFHIVLEPVSKSRLQVELHWSLVDRANLYRIRDDEVFERLRELNAGNTVLRALSREDEWLYLCLHLVKHAVLNEVALAQRRGPEWYARTDTGNRLLWFLDLHRYLTVYGGQLDWAAIRERASRWNVLAEALQCLDVLDRLVPNGVARAALDQLDADGVRRPARAGLLGWFYHTGPGQRMIERSLRVDADFTLRPIRLFFLKRLLFPAPERLLACYGRRGWWWLPGLYLVHPFLFMRRQISGGAA
jgi:hypothetical protein